MLLLMFCYSMRTKQKLLFSGSIPKNKVIVLGGTMISIFGWTNLISGFLILNKPMSSDLEFCSLFL